MTTDPEVPGLGRSRLSVVEDDDTIAEPLVEGLELQGFVVSRVATGADDYVVEPFGFRELVARIRAVQRRTGGGAALGHGASQAPGPLVIDRGRGGCGSTVPSWS